jgi:hypothetical protein
MQLKRLSETLEKYGQNVVEDYKAALKAKGYRIADTVSVRVDAFGGVYTVVLSLADYWKYIEGGRKPGGKMPPEAPILKWIRDKGIKPKDNKIKEKQLAFLIRRKIGRDGIKPKPMLSDSVEANSNIIDEIVNAYRVDILEGLTMQIKL